MFKAFSEIDTLMTNGELEEAEALLYSTADELTIEATTKCEMGDFRGALEIYRRIIKLMQRYYGDSVDFSRLELNISEIRELIDNKE